MSLSLFSACPVSHDYHYYLILYNLDFKTIYIYIYIYMYIHTGIIYNPNYYLILYISLFSACPASRSPSSSAACGPPARCDTGGTFHFVCFIFLSLSLSIHIITYLYHSLLLYHLFSFSSSLCLMLSCSSAMPEVLRRCADRQNSAT